MLVAVRLKAGCINHQRVRFAALICQFQEHPRKDAFLAPPIPTTVEGLGRAAFRRRVPPT